MTTDSFTIRSIEAFCYRYPLATPVVTSFGKMLNRPAVFVDNANEDRGAVEHLAERGHHRRLQRVAIAERLDRANGKGVRHHVAD